MTAPRPQTPGEALLHPAALAAIALLVLNDHWAKAAFPGLVTGKLSDVAGLFFFPLLLQAAWEWAQSFAGSFAPTRRALLIASAATAVAFALVKTWPPATAAYGWCWGAMQWPAYAVGAWLNGHATPALLPVVAIRDLTDLWAIPSCLGALLLRREAETQRTAGRAAGGTSAEAAGRG